MHIGRIRIYLSCWYFFSSQGKRALAVPLLSLAAQGFFARVSCTAITRLPAVGDLGLIWGTFSGQIYVGTSGAYRRRKLAIGSIMRHGEMQPSDEFGSDRSATPKSGFAVDDGSEGSTRLPLAVKEHIPGHLPIGSPYFCLSPCLPG